MDNSLLITRPRYDEGTEYLSAYSKEVIKFALKMGFLLKDFEGESANFYEFEKYLNKKNPRLVFLNGHGNSEEIYGHKDEMIVCKDNANLLWNKIVYVRACFAGALLGYDIVGGKEGCFLGYKFPFSFWISNNWSAKPLNDKIAALYLRPSNEVMISLIKGKTSKEAFLNSRKMMRESMREILLMEEKKEPGAMNMLEILWGNYEGQVLIGNESAII